jgi:hypothetical protein
VGELAVDTNAPPNVDNTIILHSRDGRCGDPPLSSLEQVQKVIADALSAGASQGLVIHFHGGLVSARQGIARARELNGPFRAAQTLPLFFIWESGLLETIKNNLEDILADPVFRELVKKAGEWVLKKSANAFLSKGAGGLTLDDPQWRSEFDDWFDGKAAAPPVDLDSPDAAKRTKASLPDEDSLATEIESELDNGSDPRFVQVLAGLCQNSGRARTLSKGVASTPDLSVPVLVDKKALTDMFGDPNSEATRGVMVWFKVAKFVARVAIAVIKRLLKHRDHGVYTTIVEEVLNAAYVGKVGEVIWDMMKKDTADAFDRSDGLGRAVLIQLQSLKQKHQSFPQITLIGHSTGAVFICNLLKQALTLMPGQKFNVIFLAPACTCDLFAETLQKAGDGIANFRQFAMHDALESRDAIVPVIYLRSLLYCVSGLFEPAGSDTPILGMERFFAQEQVFSGSGFEAVTQARDWLKAAPGRTVWSDASETPGMNSLAHHHGDFETDHTTLESVKTILSAGF